MSNVVPFPKGYNPNRARRVEEISLDMFVAADEARTWTSRHFVNGMTMLQCERGILICDADARCTAIYYATVGIEEQLAAITAAIA